MEKLLVTGAVTVRATVVVWVAEAAVPVIVTVTGPPRVALPLAVRVSVELPPAVTEVGLNAAVTPDGRPLAARATDSAEPETRAVLIVLVPRRPGPPRGWRDWR